MKNCSIVVLLCSIWASAGSTVCADEASQSRRRSNTSAAATVDEARVRARLLHETIRGTLQVVHRDFFDEDDAHAIPSASLEDVFHELARGYDVEVKWLNVQTDVLNIDHQPEGEFEKDAAKAIAKGKPHFERTENGRFRYAGRIRLASQCLKCHVKNRTTAKDRAAGLLISMPVSAVARQRQ